MNRTKKVQVDRPEEASKAMEALLEAAVRTAMTSAEALITALAQIEAIANSSSVTGQFIFTQTFDAMSDLRKYLEYYKKLSEHEASEDEE